jgi:ketosteroid isomerase-like protein
LPWKFPLTAAFSAGDLETVMSLFDDDVEWVQPGQSCNQDK